MDRVLLAYGRPMRIPPSLLALSVATLVVTACGSESSGPGATAGTPERKHETLVTATAPTGEVVEFTDFAVACRPSEDEQPKAQLVYAWSGFGDDAEHPTKPHGPAMMIEAADTTGGMTVELPYDEVYGREKTFISVFVTRAGREREIASGTELSRGEIEIVDASCDPAPHIAMRIDGVMESELSDNTVRVEGYVDAGG